jgi:hypothetical protein
MTKQATCTTMIYTDGTNTRYAVMRGPMGKKSFNMRKAVTVATYDVKANALRPADYRAMTAAHATVDAPAVYWQA